MAIRRISNMLRGFGTEASYLRNDQLTSPEASTFARAGNSPSATDGAFAEVAIIQAVADRSGALVAFRGQSVRATQATDEPLRAGQQVYISKTRTGEHIILGSVR